MTFSLFGPGEKPAKAEAGTPLGDIRSNVCAVQFQHTETLRRRVFGSEQPRQLNLILPPFEPASQSFAAIKQRNPRQELHKVAKMGSSELQAYVVLVNACIPRAVHMPYPRAIHTPHPRAVHAGTTSLTPVHPHIHTPRYATSRS